MIEKNKVLIVDQMHYSIIPLLENSGFFPDYQPDIKRGDIMKIIEGYIGIIVRSKTDIDAELIDKAVNLRFVARAGAGMDKVDKDYLESKNIMAVNAPEGNRDALGEHVLGMLLSLMHKIGVAHDEVRGGIWNREGNRGYELKGKTVGIYGYGYMGEAFAEKLTSFGCTIVAYDKYKIGFGHESVEEVDLVTFQDRVEILSLHVPLTPDTKYLFDYQNLKNYPKLKILLNTARGKVLKLIDALEMMENGHLFGLGLDVLENEKLATYTEDEKEVFERLVKIKNVVLTPHVGGWTFESYKRINEVIINKIASLL